MEMSIIANIRNNWRLFFPYFGRIFIGLFIIGILIIEGYFFSLGNITAFSLLFLPMGIVGAYLSRKGTAFDLIYLPIWILGIAYSGYVLVTRPQEVDIFMPLILMILLGVYGGYFCLYSVVVIHEANFYLKSPEKNSQGQHTGIIVVHYKNALLDYSVVGLKTLLGGFLSLRWPYRIQGLIEKEPYKVYHCYSAKEIESVIRDPLIMNIWLFGHGVKHGVSVGDGLFYYCQVSDAPKKDFIAQLHCNPGGGKALGDYIISENPPGHGIISDSYRNCIKNILAIRKYLKGERMTFTEARQKHKSR